jgi:hypothetical protein
MPLLDHFRPPLSVQRHWHSFHHAWATTIAFRLNQHLPSGLYAEPNVQFGIEIDVAAFENVPHPPIGEPASPIATALWEPPSPVLTLPLPLITDIVEVQVFSESGGPTLVGAIELVSPANKDRPAHREAFVAKCQSLLQQGIGLVVVDTVTERTASLHRDLLTRLQAPHQNGAGHLYAAAYRPVDRDGQPSLDVWYEPLAVSAPLPTLPLWLRGALCLPVELETTYAHTCRELRITLT